MTYEEVEALVEVTGPEESGGCPFVYTAALPRPGGRLVRRWSVGAPDSPHFEKVRGYIVGGLVRHYLKVYAAPV